MPRQLVSRAHRFVTDTACQYQPVAEPFDPRETQWAPVTSLDEYLLTIQSDKDKPLAGVIKEIGQRFEGWLGQPLYVLSQMPEEKEYARAAAFAHYLKEERIMNRMQRRENPTDLPQLVKYTAVAEGVGSYPTDGNPAEQPGHGASLSVVRALWKALGECAERYAQSRYRKSDFVYTSFSRLGGEKAVDPARISSFSQAEREKNQYFQFDDSSTFGWAEAKDLLGNKNVLAPAQIFHYNYLRVQGEPLLRQQVSTGTAGGFSFEAALYGALCEGIERDAFMISFLNSLPLPRIDLDSVRHPEVQRLVAMFRRYQIRLEVLDMTTDIKVPSMLAIAIDEVSDRGPAVGAGAKVDTDLLWAIRGSIEEVWHTFAATRLDCERRPQRIFRPWSNENLLHPVDRLNYWARPQMRKHIQFYLKGPIKRYRGSPEFSERNPQEQLPEVLKALERANLHDIYYREVTIPPLQKMGFRVIATLIPELICMYLNEGQRGTGGLRLRTVPAKMGLKAADRFNLVPHPFA